MSEEIKQPDELSLLKDRAKKLGIPVQGNLSASTLKELIDAKLAPAEKPTTTHASKNAKHKAIRDEAMKLIRVKITCMNPSKKNMQGEIFSVGNKVIGTVKKFIPFSPSTHENGYHIPKVLLDALRKRKFQTFREVKHDNGQKTSESVMVTEFAIETMEPLTEAELESLARDQRAKAGI